MKKSIEKRVLEAALFTIKNHATVRETAKKVNASKSTVHHDLTIRLEFIDKKLHSAVAKILQRNKEERSIRGGIATKEKYNNIGTMKKCS